MDNLDIHSKATREFDRRQSCERYSDGTTYFFANGAMREVAVPGRLVDPPDPKFGDEAEHLYALRILRFHELKEADALAKFETLNDELSNLADISDHQLQKLAGLRDNVRAAAKETARARAALGQTAIGKQRIANAQAEEERRQRFAEAQARRRKIRI